VRVRMKPVHASEPIQRLTARITAASARRTPP
jgi:hypothetical protein